MKDKKKTWKRVLLSWLIDLVIAVVIAGAILMVIKPTIVKGPSMQPRFYENDYLIVYKLAYHSKMPQKGDVVILKANITNEETGEKEEQLLIKRVIGLPGDVIDIKGGEVYINGEKDEQIYTSSGKTDGKVKGHKVPEGHIYCLGDNRAISRDSRDKEIGDVDMEQVVGKAVLRVFPVDRIGTFRNPYSYEE